MTTKQIFYCRFCGESFNLSNEDQENYEAGCFLFEPDTCPDCFVNHSISTFEPAFSDADIGL